MGGPFFSSPGEDPVRGCLTSPGRLSWTAPLAHGGKACGAQNTVSTPARLLILSGSCTELRKRSVVP